MGSISPNTATQFLVIGAGSRGEAYARAVQASTTGIIAAVAEIDDSKRQRFGRKYVWRDNDNTSPQEGQSFSDWTEYVAWEHQRRSNPSSGAPSTVNITGVFICTLDETHAEIIRALAPLNLHIMCEKPLALSLDDCLSISDSLMAHQQQQQQDGPTKIFSIGHVLRYSPHNMTLRKLLLTDQVIGEIVSIEHTEPVGWWHFSHSYVRGNWRRSHDHGVGSLLTKSCHDIDFILWLLCSPSELTGHTPHMPSSISSHGAVTHFRRARKPSTAGDATNCLSCPAEPDCMYSAKKVYVEKHLREKQNTGWPVKIVVPEIEDVVRDSGWNAGEARLLERLAEDYDKASTRDEDVAKRSWYGRCVYESDNNVVDDQTVLISWDGDDGGDGNSNDNDAVYGRGPKQAVFHMTYPTVAQCDRRGRIYGSTGEISYDSRTITIHTFKDGQTKIVEIPKQAAEVERSHGGGDSGLAAAFVNAVQAVDAGELDVHEAQRRFVGCDLDEIVRSHAVVFAAEEARLQKKVVNWNEWCARTGVTGVAAAATTATATT